MSDWQTYLLTQISNDVRETRESVRGMKAKMEEATTWLQRLGLLVSLWLAGLLTNSSPERIGETMAALVKSLK